MGFLLKLREAGAIPGKLGTRFRSGIALKQRLRQFQRFCETLEDPKRQERGATFHPKLRGNKNLYRFRASTKR